MIVAPPHFQRSLQTTCSTITNDVFFHADIHVFHIVRQCQLSDLRECSFMMNSIPMAAQKSSRTRQIIEINMPTSVVMPICAEDITNPPSLPPSCRGKMNRRFAKSDVNESIRNEWTKVSRLASLPKTCRMRNISMHCSTLPMYSNSSET